MLGRAHTIRAEVTPQLWYRHLTGECGLGIIPINENSEVKFAAIDVDEYPLDLGVLHQKIRDHQLPLVICRTKSGGAHLYLFLDKFYPAKDVQRKMREFASCLGYGSSEIFPKQTKILSERGDMGQWINMPYFNVKERPMIGDAGVEIDLAGFVRQAKMVVMTLAQLSMIQTSATEILHGGPPCLQHLIKLGFPEGTRNNGLFNLAVYARKYAPDHWRELVMAMNQRYMDPALSVSDVEGVIKSVGKKDFNYLCSQPPIVNFCNRDVCVTCKHGVGGGGAGFPKFGSLTKVLTNPPIWFLEVEGDERLELSTRDLQSPRDFQHRCMEVLNVMPPMIKPDAWAVMIRQLLEHVIEVEIPFESQPIGILHQHLVDFCTSRVSGRSLDDLIMGKPHTFEGRHYFRMRDFLDYLDRQRFKMIPLNQVANYVKELNCQHHFRNIKGRGINYFSIEEFKDRQDQPFDKPQTGTTPF